MQRDKRPAVIFVIASQYFEMLALLIWISLYTPQKGEISEERLT